MADDRYEDYHIQKGDFIKKSKSKILFEKFCGEKPRIQFLRHNIKKYEESKMADDRSEICQVRRGEYRKLFQIFNVQ